MLIEDLYIRRENIPESEGKSLDCLLQVINDWPNSFESLEEYLDDIKRFLNTKTITIESVRQKLNLLNPKINAWEMESLTGLLELMTNKTTNKLIDEITHQALE